jgi:RNA methyltransferase, TrmH family
MPVRVVASKQNARVKELRKALTQPSRDTRGFVGVEGPKMLEEALRARLRVATVFVAQGSERLLDALSLPPEIEVLQLPRALLESALATETPQPMAALVEPPDWSWAHLLGQHDKNTLAVVLAGIQDPGNLGTIVRSAEAFGATGIVSLPGTVSAWNPKAVRASAGSVFRVPVIASNSEEYFARFRASKVTTYATALREANPIEKANLAGAVAVLIGNEGNGVADDLIAKADAKITIPCPGPVESLNAAMAATVLLYEAARQRSTSIGKPSGRPQRPSKSLPHAVEHRGVRR